MNRSQLEEDFTYEYKMGDQASKDKKFDIAKIYFTKALQNAIKLNDLAKIVITHNSIGMVCKDLKELQEANKHFRKALEITKSQKDQSAQSTVLINLAGNLKDIAAIEDNKQNLKQAFQYYDDAVNCYMHSTPFLRMTGNYNPLSGVIMQIGIIYETIGDIRSAIYYLNQAKQGAEMCNNTVVIKNVDMLLQMITLEHSPWAFQGIGENSEQAMREMGYGRYLKEYNMKKIKSLSSGLMNQKTGNFKEAIKLFSISIDCSEKIGDIEYGAGGYYLLGKLYIEIGDKTKANNNLMKALDMIKVSISNLGNDSVLSIQGSEYQQNQIASLIKKQMHIEEAIKKAKKLKKRKK